MGVKIAELPQVEAVTTTDIIIIEDDIATQYATVQQLMGFARPVGSIYMTINATNPSSMFGGTWVEWGTGRVPVGVNTSDTNFNSVQKTGGASTVTLTTSQMPSHTHTFTGSSIYASGMYNNHRHSMHAEVWMNVSGSNYFTSSSSGNYISSNTSPYSSVIGNWVEHTHTVTPTGSNSSVGSGSSHSNLQPYITCYMWRKTA